MIQERALLHYNKFKAIRHEFVKDTMKGMTLQIIKVKLIKGSNDDYNVIITVKSELDNSTYTVDSGYAQQHFKEINA